MTRLHERLLRPVRFRPGSGGACHAHFRESHHSILHTMIACVSSVFAGDWPAGWVQLPARGRPGPARGGPPPLHSATGQMGRRRFLVAGTGSAGAVLLRGPSLKALFGGSSAKARTAAGTPATIGQWTAPFDLKLVSIHAVVLHTGRFCFSRGRTRRSGATPAVGPGVRLAHRREPDLPARYLLRGHDRALGRPGVHRGRPLLPGSLRNTAWPIRRSSIRHPMPGPRGRPCPRRAGTRRPRSSGTARS